MLLSNRYRLRHGAVGLVPTGDGNTPPSGRQGKTGEAIVAQSNGKYYELASRGMVAFASVPAGVQPPSAASIGVTLSQVISLYNPVNSGRRLALLKVSLGYQSGTLAAGTFHHCVVPSSNGTAAAGGTSIASNWSDLNNLSLSAAPVGVVRTLPTAPFFATSSLVSYRPFCSAGPFTVATAQFPTPVTDDMDGEIVLEPGGFYALQQVNAGAGSTPIVVPGIVWAEIPYVSNQG